jgi:hypothetical protein
MEQVPSVMWAGNFDEQLEKLITVFACRDLPESVDLVSLSGLRLNRRLKLFVTSPGPMSDHCSSTSILWKPFVMQLSRQRTL